MLAYKSFEHRIASPALLFLAALVAGCGGGGGSSTVTTPVTAVQNCKATASTTSAGYTIGACVLLGKDANNNDVETTTSQLQDVLVTVAVDQNPPAVADPSQGLNYVLSVGATPSGPAASATLNPTPAFCINNSLGDRIGYIAEKYDDSTKPETSPRFTLLSFAKLSLLGDPKVSILNQFCKPNPDALNKIGTVLRVSDYGVWERAAGGAEIYYGGWYGIRAANSTAPASPKTFTDGSFAGYRFTSSFIYGVTGKVLSGATWDGTTMTLKLDLFKYSRRGAVTPVVEPIWTTITLTSNKVDGAKISGTVSGPNIGGTWEGSFAGAGEELVGRIRLTDNTVEHKFVGAFAVK